MTTEKHGLGFVRPHDSAISRSFDVSVVRIENEKTVRASESSAVKILGT